MSDSRSSDVTVVPTSDALALSLAIWRCYDAVFGDVDDYAMWFSDKFERHTTRDRFRLAVSFDREQVAGFAWGYIGQRGQFWSDRACNSLPAEVASQWVGNHFEFVELAVLPTHRRSRLGQALHDQLLHGVDRHCLLSTVDDPDDPAVRLYTRSGWHTLGMLSPGVQIMGLSPILAPHASDISSLPDADCRE